MFPFIKNNTFKIILIGLLVFLTSLVYNLISKTNEFNILKAQILAQQHEKLLLIQKVDHLKIVLLQLSEDNIVLVKPIEGNNTSMYICLTVIIIFTIFLTFYCTSGPIFCPIRTIS